jgi:hypothetical protein
MVDGFEKIDLNLESYRLPDVFLWIKKVEKAGTNSNVPNTNAIISEVIKGWIDIQISCLI